MIKDPHITELPDLVAGMAVYSAAKNPPQVLKSLLAKFAVEDRFGEWHQLAKIVGQSVHVPRAICPPVLADNLGRDKRTIGGPVSFEHKVKTRNKEQVRVIKEITEQLLGGESFQFQASTGFGKTVVVMPAIAAVGRKTLVIVPKMDLMASWYEALQEFLDLRRSEIGLIQGDAYNVEGKKVVLGMLKSVATLTHKYPPSMAGEFGLVVIDEIHTVPAETLAPAAGYFSAKLRLGLSATPERADGMECLNLWHIGPVKVVAKLLPMKPEVVMWETAYHCLRWGDEKAKHSPGKCGHVITHLAKDSVRLKLIVSLAMRAWRAGRKLAIFSERKEHLLKIKAGMITRGMPLAAWGNYVGGMSQAQLDASSVKPVIGGTYRMMGMGTNIPWLDACILGTPRSEVEQIIGRICREYPDKPTPVVIDLVDMDSHVFKGYARKRLRLYRKLGAKIDNRTPITESKAA